MPESLQYLIFTVIVLALLFDFINGFHDTANAIATSVSTRALHPQHAIIMAAVLNFVGAMYSTGVAKTIGADIVKSAQHVDEHIIIAALAGAIIWNILTWWLSMPSSSSHALVGGIIGAVLVSVGPEGLNFEGIGKIVISLIGSPIIGIVSGCLIMTLLFRLFGQASPSRVNHKFKRMQILAAAMMAFSHGSNDAQKSMGIITLALLSGGYISAFEVPTYVKVLCAAAMACGTAFGGWRITKINNQFLLCHLYSHPPAPACQHDPRGVRLHHGCRHGEARECSALGCRPANGDGLGHDHSLHGGNGGPCLSSCAECLQVKRNFA